MKRLIFLILLLASPALAQDVGFYVRADCGTLSPVNNSTVCLQQTTADGRIGGITYVYVSGAWTPLSGGHTIEDEGVALAQRETMNFVGNGIVVTDSAGKTTVTVNPPFSSITAGTNTNALVVGTGGSVGISGTGTITSNRTICTGSEYLKADGTCASPSAATASGNDTEVQFNDTGSQAGDAGLTYNKTSNVLTSGGFVGALTGNVTGNVTGNLTGTASAATLAAGATALAANGANCAGGSFAAGVDASGVSEGCTALPTTITGTSGEITASSPTGSVVLSLPSAVNLSSHTLRVPNSNTLPGSCSAGEVFLDTDATSGQRWYACESGIFVLQGGSGSGSGDVTDVGDCTTGACFSASGSGTSQVFRNATSGTITVTPVAGALGTRTLSLPASTGTLAITSGNVATSTALAANGANCSAGSAPLGVDASGAAETCTDYMEEPSGTGIVAKTSANSATGRTLTGTTGNITISNGTGVAGDPTFDVGSTVVQTDQANTWSTGAQDMSAATTLTIPVTAGAAPTVSGRLHYDSTSNQLEYGLNGSNKIVVNTGDLTSYLPLAGATMTGLLTTDNLGIEFEESDTNPTCAAGNYNIYADLSDTRLMACVNGTASAVGSVITGTSNVVTVTNGNGISGAPTITLPTPIIDGSSHYAADAGSSDDYAITLTPAPGSYITGAHYRFKANTANTAAATLAVNGLAATPIVKVTGGVTTALATNDIRVGQLVDVVYDGTNMQMQSTLGNAAAGVSGSLATTNCLAMELTSSSVECSSIVDDAAGNVSVGTIGADYHQFTFSAPTGGIVHTWPAVTGTVAQTTGSLTTGNYGKFDSSGRIIDGGGPKAYWDAAGITPDGTQCAEPAKTTINSGPVAYVIVCTDNAASIFYGQVALTATLTTATFTLTVNDVDSSSQHFGGGFSAQCRNNGTTVNSTWGTATTVDITMTTANNNYTGTTSATTPNGTCGSGATLFWRFVVDAAGTHTDDGDARVIGVLMQQAS